MWLLVGILLMAGMMNGGVPIGSVVPFMSQDASSTSLMESSAGSEPAVATLQCCDSGDGDACHVGSECFDFILKDGTIKKKYCKIKSTVAMAEQYFHLKESSQKYNNNPIFTNESQDVALRPAYCGVVGFDDLMWDKEQDTCAAIPDDEVIYVCTQDCDDIANGPTPDPANPNWTTKARFDVYYLNDSDPTLPTPTIPDFIKKCYKKGAIVGGSTEPKFEVVNPDAQTRTLQLKTFTVEQKNVAIPWFSPYCKPAIYLYPPQKTQVSVKLAPKGKLMLTIPAYPPLGWLVDAYPDGKIVSDGKNYPYLYYEAAINDGLLPQTDKGYIVRYSGLSSLFTTLLPALGLNEKEQREFSDYWLKALPSSPYYFVGIVSPADLDAISPLTISPKPDATIRVTLVFKSLDEPISIREPNFTPVKRSGFTVVEWGGIFKTDPAHPFSCLM